jgi:hypothetical protein
MAPGLAPRRSHSLSTDYRTGTAKSTNWHNTSNSDGVSNEIQFITRSYNSIAPVSKMQSGDDDTRQKKQQQEEQSNA